jgi:hypothetical protein
MFALLSVSVCDLNVLQNVVLIGVDLKETDVEEEIERVTPQPVRETSSIQGTWSWIGMMKSVTYSIACLLTYSLTHSLTHSLKKQ